MLTKFKDDQRVMGWWCNRVTLVRVTPDITLNNVTPSVTLSNVTPPNNLLLNSYFENPTIELHILYVLNMYTNFHANRM